MSVQQAAPLLTGVVTALALAFWKLVEGVAFWTAVALPFAYTPVLVTGAYFDLGLLDLGVLLALNAFAFLVGRGHNRPVDPTAAAE